MDDAELGLRLVKALRAATASRLPNGNPIKGKLMSLALNITPEDWQVIGQFWFTHHCNVQCSKDPATALLTVLETPPNLTDPYDPKQRLLMAKPVLREHVEFVTGKRDPEPAPKPQPALANYPTAQEDEALDLSDLLV